MRKMDLLRYANKLAGTLSGGNKRKLCVAIAMVGQPSVVFLDEPSTGVDPVARRFMWDIISDICTERQETTVILTTHNMEECEALCTRVGIMVGGYMRCLGSVTHLRARFGNGYQLELKLDNPLASATAGIVHSSGIQFPTAVTMTNIFELCAALGDGNRAHCVNPDDEAGFGLWQSLQSNGSCTPDYFASWYLMQDYRAALLVYVVETFPGSELVEQHEQNFRFRIPSQGVHLKCCT
eukprot:SAG31_NODE_753_length_12340_cov_8.786619_4_plen_238_part_00